MKDDKDMSFEAYQAIVEQAPIMIWRSDISTKCDYFNDTWLKFTGRTIEQEMGNGWAEGVHKDDFDRCLEIYLGSFKKREIFEMEYRLKRHDGEYRWLFDRGVPFYSEKGEFVGFIGSCIDVTESVKARESNAKELKELRALLPICANCKKVRDDKGYWHSIEKYFKDNTKQDITHSICPECEQKLYPKDK